MTDPVQKRIFQENPLANPSLIRIFPGNCPIFNVSFLIICPADNGDVGCFQGL
jgi:hypothetical protein